MLWLTKKPIRPLIDLPQERTATVLRMEPLAI